jgi:hypothetical protein
MYIVAIAWIFVTLCMALTEPNFVAGVLTFFFYGLAPLALLLWLLGTPQRRRNLAPEASVTVARENADQPDGTHAKRDQ